MKHFHQLFGSVLLAAALAGAVACAQTGVLVPGDEQAPDPSVLSLQEMSVDITIDDGDARVFVTQIFLNHTGNIEEGTYQFPLPGGTTVSDFAVWDGAVRIPAVILERKRAEDVYEQARSQAIDPGLLQMGERTGANPAEKSLFSAKIVPIPPWGTKRVEIEYHQKLEATALEEGFVLPLKPDTADTVSVRHFRVHLNMHSSHSVSDLRLGGAYAFKIAQQDTHGLTASFEGSDVKLSDDMTLSWKFDAVGTDTLAVIAHRDTKPPAASTVVEQQAPAGPSEPGFFEASALLGEGDAAMQSAGSSGNPAQPETPAQRRTVIVLFDTSLSMQWDKLERSFAATEALLHSLTPTDRFDLLLFNQKVTQWQPQPVPADAQHVTQALDFIRSSYLRGGTDIGRALTAGLALCSQANTSLVLFTDGNSDRGDTVLAGKIAASYVRQQKLLAQPPRTDIFAVGDDANLGLLQLLAGENGVVQQVLSTEPVELPLHAFLSKVARMPVRNLSLDVSPGSAVRMVYPLEQSIYPGSTASWVGEYTQPSKIGLEARGLRDNTPFTIHADTLLPSQELDHPQLPRLWAQARVQALLAEIDRDGESRAAIAEIIELARRYKLVTPYTSFLAVPRSLLRPRVIRPGDPVLRVRTDPAIDSVIAIFPFGLTKPLRHLADEDTPDRDGTGGVLWETRFLVPTDMHDGTYGVRLILRDRAGNVYRENKSFVIASTPPVVKILLPERRLHRGETILLRAIASRSTRTLTARMPGVLPVSLRWNPTMEASTGELAVPANMPIGTYSLSVTAEDVAHNLGSEEVSVDVVP